MKAKELAAILMQNPELRIFCGFMDEYEPINPSDIKIQVVNRAIVAHSGGSLTDRDYGDNIIVI